MRYQKAILPCGIRIIKAPKQDSRAVTIMVMAETGSKYESQEINGLSHFIEHMCFKGTPRRPRTIDISSEFDAIGAQCNAFTSQEYTGYYATVWPKHFNKALDLLADLYLNPLFDEKEIEKEKGVVIEEINMYEDKPTLLVFNLFTQLLYGNQPAGWNILGTKELVKKFKRQDLEAYKNKHYVAGGTVVVIAGKYDPKTVDAKIERKFAKISQSPKAGKLPTKERQVKPQIALQPKKLDQSHLVLGFRGYNMYDRRAFVADVLSTILGGSMSARLWQKIREEMGVAYYVRAANDGYTDHGNFNITIGADNKRIKEVITAVLGECRRLKRERVGKKELQMVKDYIIGNLYLDLETSGQLAYYYATQESVRRRLLTPEDYAKKINSVTAPELQRVAREMFRNNKLNLAVVGPHKHKREFARVLKI
jgi:predicted Zn-dependent peptidase